MGMNRGKVLKAAKNTRVRAKSAKPRAAKSKAAKPKKAAARPVKAAAPKVVTKVVTKTVTKTVEVDRARPLRELAQRIVDLTIANNDEASLALYAANVESKEANNPASVGIDAIVEKFKGWRQFVSSATFIPRSVTVDGSSIIIEWEGRVTLAASGRVAELNEIAVHEIENGKIVKERFYYDPASLQS